jgi:hypothetical protein
MGDISCRSCSCPKYRRARAGLMIDPAAAFEINSMGWSGFCRCGHHIDSHGLERPPRGPAWSEKPLVKIGNLVVFSRSALYLVPLAVALMIWALTVVNIHATSKMNSGEAALLYLFIKVIAVTVTVGLLSRSSPLIRTVIRVTLKIAVVLGIIVLIGALIYWVGVLHHH